MFSVWPMLTCGDKYFPLGVVEGGGTEEPEEQNELEEAGEKGRIINKKIGEKKKKRKKF